MSLINQSEEFRKIGHELVDFLADYLISCQNQQTEVTNPVPPDLSFEFWNEVLHKPTMDTFSLFKEIVSRSIHLHHPGYIGHQVAAGHPMGILADFVASTLDNGMAVYEMGEESVQPY